MNLAQFPWLVCGLVNGLVCCLAKGAASPNPSVWQPGPHQDASVAAQSLFPELGPEASGITRSTEVNLGYTERVRLELDGKGRTVLQRDCLHCGAQGELAGLGQINFRIPPELAGRGEVDLVLQHGGFTANTLRVHLANQ